MIDLSKPWPLGLNRKTWWRFALAFVALLAVVVWFDEWASVSAQAWPKPVRDFFAAITDYGLSDWVLYPSLAFMLVTAALGSIIPKRIPRLALFEMTKLYAFIFIGVGLPGLITNLFKRVIGRGRPEVLDQVGPLGFQNFINDWSFQSFPSGHAATAVALAFVVGFLSRRWFVPMLLLGLLTGFSRIVVGAHYPTDVIAGTVVGALGVYPVRAFFARRRWLFQYRADGTIAIRRPFVATHG